MLQFFDSLQTWHWIILGLLLLSGEALGAAGFMLGIAASAFIVSALLALGVVETWQNQLLIFAILSVIASVIFWIFFKPKANDSANTLNSPAAKLVGRRVTLTEDIHQGVGRIQLGDTFWKVASDEKLDAGTEIEIISHDGMTLNVQKHQ